MGSGPDEDDNEVILVRPQGAVYAFALSCSHQKQSLRWREGEARFQCPKHKSKYQPDGSYVSGRATRAMDRHPFRREGNTLRVDLATKLRRDEEPHRWDSEHIRLGYAVSSLARARSNPRALALPIGERDA